MAKEQRHRALRASMATFVITLPSCTVGPDYEEPKIEVPSSWVESPDQGEQAADEPNAADQPQGVPSEAADLAAWWTAFSDSQLSALIERAIAGNLELRVAEARIREARALRVLVGGGRWPIITAGAGYRREHPSEKGQFADLNSGITGALVGGKVIDEYELYQTGFDASWELDVFGAVRRRIEAADAQTQATIEDQRGVLVAVVAEVARYYAELRGAQRRLEIAQADVRTQHATFDLVSQKRRAGLVTDFDVTRASAQMSLSESRVPLAIQQIRLSIHTISSILAEDLDGLMDELLPHAPLPAMPDELQIGIPAELLRRRPDIRRAERTLAAASAEVGVATADLYPRFALNGRFALEASKFSWLGNWDSRTFGFGPSIRWPAFDAGRIRANISVQNARQEQALADYERTVMYAFREVEDALLRFSTAQARQNWLQQSAEASRQSVELAQLAYEQGATDLLAVLDAQRALYLAEDALAETQQEVVTNLVALYKALGGGWSAESSSGG